jgi:hypothetical protein
MYGKKNVFKKNTAAPCEAEGTGTAHGAEREAFIYSPREQTMSNTLREAWMTETLEAELKRIARDGCLSCEQIQAFAAQHALDIAQMKPFVDCIGLQVTNCRGLCA